MKKIPTILPKDPNNLGLVIPGEILENIEYFQLKIDGTSVMIKDFDPYARYDAKLIINKHGKKTFLTKEDVIKKLPIGAIQCQEPDTKSGHWPHWVLATKGNPQHQYILEAYDNLLDKMDDGIFDGTYECIGPKIQGNPHNEEKHLLIAHDTKQLRYNVDFNEMNKDSYEYFKKLFKEFPYEGLVAYNNNREPIGKIRRSDFGYINDKFNKVSPLFKHKN